MIRSIEREALVETLLDALEVERYVRGPLLLTLVDELSYPGFENAAHAARALFEGFSQGGVVDDEFVTGVRALREAVKGAQPFGPPPLSALSPLTSSVQPADVRGVA